MDTDRGWISLAEAAMGQDSSRKLAESCDVKVCEGSATAISLVSGHFNFFIVNLSIRLSIEVIGSC